MKENQKGDKNSQFGSKWIHEPKTKEIRKLRLGEDFPDGWLLGKYKEPNSRLCECGEITSTKRSRMCKCCREKRRSSVVTANNKKLMGEGKEEWLMKLLAGQSKYRTERCDEFIAKQTRNSKCQKAVIAKNESQ